jgi:hypothetical protein
MTEEKRYPLVLPGELWDEVDKTAKGRNISAADFIRRSIRLGLMAAELENTPGDALIARRKGKSRTLKVFPKRDETFFLK